MNANEVKLCRICGDEIDPPERAKLKPVCLWCGEEIAQAERKSWCVVQEYVRRSGAGYLETD